jgi:putative ABC transport system permease protein
VLPAMKVQTGDKVRADTKNAINKALSFVNYFLLAFGAIALLVGTFIIYNTFSMIVAQRLRELALLRAVGASRRQISRSVLSEAAVVGVIGAVLGIIAGIGLAYGLRALLNAFGTGLPSGSLQIQVRTIVVALVVGIVVTAVSAYAPARRASKIPPVAAMREEFASTGSSLRRRTAIGLVFGVIAVVALAAGGLGPSGGGSAGFVGLGALAGVIAVLLGAPALSRPIVGAVGLLLRPFGAVGRLSRTNAVRNPRRTAATAFALTLGLMLVSAIAVLGQSTKGSINALVDNGVKADYILTGPDNLGVPVAAGEAAAKVDGVQTAVALHNVEVQIGGKTTLGTGADGALESAFTVDLISGSFTYSGHNIVAGQSWAKSHKVNVGSTIAVKSIDGKALTLKLAGIYKDNQLAGSWLGSGSLYREVTPTRLMNDIVVLVKAKPGTNLTTLRSGLVRATDPYVVVQVQTRSEFKGTQAKQINSLLAVLYGLLALAIVIAILGIINTLALSVVERRREIGMLRAVGMIRAQVRRTIYLESALIALFGAIVGVALGLVFGALFVRTLRDQGLGQISVPWGQAVLFLVISGVVGVLAALWPGVRAARTPPLAAINDV